MTASLSEFELIERYFRQLGCHKHEVALGVGDDCAVVTIPSNHQLCLSIDTMVEGVHFPAECPAKVVAHRALAAAVSDLAAMGATPSHFTLALTLPKIDQHWIGEFATALASLAMGLNMSLVGGDTTRGPLAVSVQVHGFVPNDQALKRSGAQVGDIIAVTGSLGDAGAGLQLALETSLDSPERLFLDNTYLLERYFYPTPRINEGLALRLRASACIDISDGLLADAAHIAKTSGVNLQILEECLPISAALESVWGKEASGLAVKAGDDYELLFTMSEENWRDLLTDNPDLNATKIGKVAEGEGVTLMRHGKHIEMEYKGYQHFE